MRPSDRYPSSVEAEIEVRMNGPSLEEVWCLPVPDSRRQKLRRCDSAPDKLARKSISRGATAGIEDEETRANPPPRRVWCLPVPSFSMEEGSNLDGNNQKVDFDYGSDGRLSLESKVIDISSLRSFPL